MTGRVEIKVGQRWESRDSRDGGLVAVVLAVDGDTVYENGFVTVQRLIKSRMRVSTLRSRYRLLSGVQQ